MAAIDYGALLRVNGVFKNKDCDLFHPENSDVCSTAVGLDGTEEKIKGNYFIYAGDEHFLVCVYKGLLKVISEGQVVFEQLGCSFLSETFFLEGLPNITIEHLDKKKYRAKGFFEITESDRQDFQEIYGKRKGIMMFRRYCKRAARVKNGHSRYGLFELTGRYLASWTYDGKRYEVIYGSGIEPVQRIWNDIKDFCYGFTDTEREVIDRWFEN